MAGEAAQQGAQVIAFHECSITGYTWARSLSKDQMLDICEVIPGGPSVKRLQEIAATHNIVVLAGTQGGS
jgi:predicted amidohydrolase